jgi:hypothetical protein
MGMFYLRGVETDGISYILYRSLRKVKKNNKKFIARAFWRGIAKPTTS